MLPCAASYGDGAHQGAASTCEGTLSALPADLFDPIFIALPIEDLATLGMTSRRMAVMIDNPLLPYARVLQGMRLVLSEDVGIAHTVKVLGSIATLPPCMRPATLRSLACRLVLPGLDEPLERSVSDVWEQVIADAWKALPQAAGRENYTQSHADLDVAACKACYVTDEKDRGAFIRCFFARLPTIPMPYWPELLDATISRSGDLIWPDLAALLENIEIRLPRMSDLLAEKFVQAALRIGDTPPFALMRDRFGVTEGQCETLLYPAEGLRIAFGRLSTDTPFSRFWESYPEPHPVIVTVAEHAELERALGRFHAVKNGWREITRSCRSPLSREEGDLWRNKSVAYFRRVEAAAYASVEKGGDVATPSEDVLMTAYIRLTLRMEDQRHCLACLEEIWDMPMGFQPALLDRWAMFMDRGALDSRYDDALVWIAEWRVHLVAECCKRGEYVNAVRACVATLRACARFNDDDIAVVGPLARQLTSQVFDTMPIEATGAMLSFLAESAAGNAPLIADESLSGWTRDFLRSPASRLVYTSYEFSSHLCWVAGPVFCELPDQASGAKTKYDMFCERMAIRLRSREQMRLKVLRGVAARIKPDTPRLRAVVRTELANAGFHDAASFADVLTHLRRRPSNAAPEDAWQSL